MRHLSTPLQQSATVPPLEDRKQPGGGDSRSFPGQYGQQQPSSYAVGGAALRANRSLSSDDKVRDKVLSMPALPNPEEEPELGDDGEPLLKSAWMSIVGVAGKFLGRAQERHQWSEARVGMMNRLLSKKPSMTSRGGSFNVDDEGSPLGGKMLRPMSNSKTSVSTATQGDNDHAHSMSTTRGGGGASISATRGAGTEWADGTSSTTSNMQHRDHRLHRERESSERSLPQLFGPSGHVIRTGSGSAQHSGSGTAAGVRFQSAVENVHPGSWQGRVSADQAVESFDLRDGRKVLVDPRKKQQGDEFYPRQSGSGSNSTRYSIPTMPPLPRQKSQQLQSEPQEDHLHGLLNKLRARRLGQEAAGYADGAGSASGSGSGAGPSPRRHATQDLSGLDPHAVARRQMVGASPSGQAGQAAISGGQTGSRMLRQRFGALLAPDVERRPFDASRPRQAALAEITCDLSTSERVASWLANAAEGAAEPPPDSDGLAVDGGTHGLAGTESVTISRHESLDRDSGSAGPDRPSSLHDKTSPRRLISSGNDGFALHTAGGRPWKSMNGGQGQLPMVGVEEGTEEQVAPGPPKVWSPVKHGVSRHSPQKVHSVTWQPGMAQVSGVQEEDEEGDEGQG